MEVKSSKIDDLDHLIEPTLRKGGQQQTFTLYGIGPGGAVGVVDDVGRAVA